VPVEVADRIDKSADRAERLLVTRRAVAAGCGTGPAAAACRGELVRAAAAFASSGRPGGGPPAMVAAFAERFARRHPQGLARLSGDLSDRDPLAAVAAGALPAQAIAVLGVHDPTVERVPLVWWAPRFDPEALWRDTAIGLAEALGTDRLQRLAARLGAGCTRPAARAPLPTSANPHAAAAAASAPEGLGFDDLFQTRAHHCGGPSDATRPR
jgi:hypothetical protein